MTENKSTQAAFMTARCDTRSERSHIAPCERTLRIGFFFDGFGRHLLKDLQSGRISNIGKMYLAHTFDMPNVPADPLNAYRKFYLSGLGEEYIADLTTAANGSLGSFGSAASEAPGDIARDEALDTAKDLLDGKRSWWERLTRDLNDLLRKPHKAVKALKDALVESTLEFMPPLRDSAISAQLLKTGANTRIEGAIDRLNLDISEIASLGGARLKRIELSVYGFDYGATLARAFIQELLSRCLPQGTEHQYQGASLNILFVGLFDGVDRSHSDTGLLPLPTRTVLDDGGLMPDAVRKALHLVAGHERRFYRRARLLGSSNPNWREEWLPGVSEDIGGSLLPGEQKSSAELALVSLHRMYRAAYMAGAPFLNLDELYEKDADTASLFIFNDHLDGRNALALVRHYQNAARASAAELARYRPQFGGRAFSTHQTAFLGHMRIYIRWLASIWHPYQARVKALNEEETRLQNRQFQGSTIGGLLGRPMETPREQESRLKQLQALKQEREALIDALGWLQDVADEANSLRDALTNPVVGWQAAGTRDHAEVVAVLLAEWFAERPQEVPQPIHQLFGHFIHDRQVLSDIQRTVKTLGGQHFFDIRGFDSPGAAT